MRTTLPCFVVLLLMAFPAIGENLLVNPGFTSNLDGWTPYLGSVIATWNGFDADGSATSGSVNLRSINPAASRPAVLVQCVPVSAGELYDIGAKIQIPGNQTHIGSANPAVVFFSSADCSTPTSIGQATVLLSPQPRGRFVAAGRSNVVAPAGARSAIMELRIVKREAGGSFQANFDDAFFGPSGGCLPTETFLCLANGRFRVQTAWEAPGGASGFGQAIQLTPDSGYFWFFNHDNVELIVKVLDGCGINARYWVFSGGLTNVTVHLAVTDTSTGESRTFTNQQGTAYQPIQAVEAFPTCP